MIKHRVRELSLFDSCKVENFLRGNKSWLFWTMYIHACISFIRLYYKYLHFFYKSGYITYIYCLDIFLSQSAEYCQLLDIFLSLSLEYEIKREVSRRLSLQGEYVRLWYFLSHLLFVTNCLDLFCKDDKEYVLSFDWLCCL